jgi:hypothetical protein
MEEDGEEEPTNVIAWWVHKKSPSRMFHKTESLKYSNIHRGLGSRVRVTDEGLNRDIHLLRRDEAEEFEMMVKVEMENIFYQHTNVFFLHFINSPNAMTQNEWGKNSQSWNKFLIIIWIPCRQKRFFSRRSDQDEDEDNFAPVNGLSWPFR